MDEDHLFGGIKMGKDSVKGPQFVRYFQPVINVLIALGGSGRPEEVEEKIAAFNNQSSEKIVTKHIVRLLPA